MERKCCPDGGYIGPPRIEIPQDEEIRMKTRRKINGCSRIFCRDCGSKVHYRDNARLAKQIETRQENLWLYEHIGELTPRFIIAETGCRLYVCQCDYYTAVVPQDLGSLEQSWYCSGHTK